MAALFLSMISLAGVQAKAAGIKVPVKYYKLPNGLKVVLSPEHELERGHSACPHVLFALRLAGRMPALRLL